MDAKTTGRFIAELRKQKGYTQKELAEKIMVTDKAISRWETGKGLPRITAPAFSRFSTASALKVGTKFSKILEEQVVRVPSVHILSLIAKGTPARGPVSSPASIFFCTSAACCNAFSRSTVT